MEAIYDPILGKMRATDAAIAAMMKGDGLLLHLPLREDGADVSPNKLEPYSGGFSFAGGWAMAGSQVSYDLTGFELDEVTMTGNLVIPRGTIYVDVFGIESNQNTFYWQKRYGNSFVLETISGSFDLSFPEAGDAAPFHISATYGGRMIHCYLNGILLNSSGWNLGFSNAALNFWPSGCRFSDVRLYAKALNAAEINDIYEQDRRG